ncbi:MAG: glycosyltransferase family 4 protein, partial [Bdellovibrio sp.]
LESADGVFVTTPQQKTYLERYYRFPEHWTTLVPYAVEVSNLIEQADQKKAREHLGISESSGIVVTFSDMNENFSLKPVLKAFAKVSLKKPLAKLIVIGMGPAFKSLERMVLDLALGSRVLFLGPKDGDDLRDCISACDVYLDLGTRSTGYDPMMIEAMSQQKIVIGSEVGPIAHVIEDGTDGFLIRPADSESLAHVLLECFLGAVSTADVGIRARSKVLHLFDARQMVKSLDEAYRKILSSR